MIAVLMSTTDSFLNIGAITLIRDFIKPLSRMKLNEEQELRLMRIETLILGALGIITALLVVLAWGLWSSAMCIPLLMGIFGHTASKQIFVLAANAGIIMFSFWEIFLGAGYGLGSSFPAIIANLSVFLAYFGYKKGKNWFSKPPVQAGLNPPFDQ